MFHSLTSRLSHQLPSFLSGCWLVAVFCFLLVWGLFCALFALVVVVCLVCIRGAFVDAFLIRSSRDMTATVLSNAALEKKYVSIQVPCGDGFGKAVTFLKLCMWRWSPTHSWYTTDSSCLKLM